MSLTIPHLSHTTRRSIYLSEILRIMVRRSWLVALCAVLVSFAAYVVSRQFPYEYTASGDLVVDSRPFAIPELQGAVSGQGYSDPLPSVRTEAVELHSPALLESVVRVLNLDQSPLFNPELRQPGMLAPVVTWLHDVLPGTAAPTTQRKDAAVALAAGTLGKLQTVFYDNRSFVVSVSVVLPDAQLATDIVNTTLREHIAQRAKRRTAENAAANAALTHRVDDVHRQIDGLDGQLSQLRSQPGMINLPAGSRAQQRVSELETASNRATDDRVHAETLLQQAQSLASSGRADELADVLASPTIARLREREAAASGHAAELATSFGPGHPARRAADSDMRRARMAISEEVARQVQSLKTAYATALDREATAKSALEKATVGASQVSLAQSQISQLEREIASRRVLYQTLLERASQTAAQPENASQAPGVYIGSLAVVPVQPSAPRPKIAAALGGLGGLALGCALALLGGAAPRFNKAGEIAALTDVPLLAVAPATPRRQARRGEALSFEQEEALSFLRLRLRQQAVQTGIEIRSVAITATNANDGLAFARLFARSAAQAGERVLLIDAAGQSRNAPGAVGGATDADAPGWRDLLTCDSSSSMAILADKHGLTDLSYSRNVDRMRSLLREAADDYNLVVVASATDARSIQTSHIAVLTNYTVLVVDLATARRSTIMSRIEHLRFMSSRLGLLVISRDRRGHFAAQGRQAMLSNA